jgi:hypothetical protein
VKKFLGTVCVALFVVWAMSSFEVFVYSKSLNAIVYKGNLTLIFEQKSGTSKTARRTIFRSCLEEVFQPFFDKAANPAATIPTDEQ